MESLMLFFNITVHNAWRPSSSCMDPVNVFICRKRSTWSSFLACHPVDLLPSTFTTDRFNCGGGKHTIWNIGTSLTGTDTSIFVLNICCIKYIFLAHANNQQPWVGAPAPPHDWYSCTMSRRKTWIHTKIERFDVLACLLSLSRIPLGWTELWKSWEMGKQLGKSGNVNFPENPTVVVSSYHDVSQRGC